MHETEDKRITDISMNKRTIVPLSELDLPGLLALNNAHAKETSWLDEIQLNALMQKACYARGVKPAEAFLLAFDPSAKYDNRNFNWFRERYRNFIYIDRIVVASTSRRQGLAGALYSDLIEWAAQHEYDFVGCEINQVPPNLSSDVFHEKMGFTQVGEGHLSTDKQVRYLVRHI